jgi:uncharacterized membrane protein (DUF485 family)
VINPNTPLTKQKQQEIACHDTRTHRKHRQPPRLPAPGSAQAPPQRQLTLAMLVIYYGFVLLVAFSPYPRPVPQRRRDQRRHAGGCVMVLLSFALTGIYVHRANNVLDPLNDKVKQECAQ